MKNYIVTIIHSQGADLSILLIFIIKIKRVFILILWDMDFQKAKILYKRCPQDIAKQKMKTELKILFLNFMKNLNKISPAVQTGLVSNLHRGDY